MLGVYGGMGVVGVCMLYETFVWVKRVLRHHVVTFSKARTLNLIFWVWGFWLSYNQILKKRIREENQNKPEKAARMARSVQRVSRHHVVTFSTARTLNPIFWVWGFG